MHRVICVCDACQPVANRTAITLVQHPRETGHAKGTARILEQCLQRFQRVCGETPEALARQGFRPERADGELALLFPGPGSQALEPSLPLPYRHWVLLDGTWRKAARLLHLNPGLSALPRFHFAEPPPSAYTVRKAPGPHHLATAEAAAHLLALTEPGLDVGPINRAMATLVDRLLAQVPDHLHHRYQR